MTKKQVKTKRQKKRRLNVKRVLLLASIIILLVLVLKEVLKVNINNIEVIGNEYVSDSQIIKLADLNDKTSFLGLNTSKTCKKITSDEMIATCKIKRTIGLKIIIEVAENRPLFMYLSTNKLVLSSGEQIDKTDTYGIPNLINYCPEEILKSFATGLSHIKSDIIRSISEIEYSPSSNSDGTYIDENRFMLEMNDGNIVYVNIRNIDALNNYDKIYASNGEKKGYYNFDTDYKVYYFEEFKSSEE